ncbi:MAG: hypothetical protein MJY58_00425 [Bacteroidaceae bacterium]|nr:hypothetical protein [Bacteroidaceae bacterium]
MNNVIIVIPVYRPFSETERKSFEQALRILGKYDISILHPVKLDIDSIMDKYAGMANISETVLDDSNFASVQSYSDLLLTTEFYDLYKDYEYMLIYQLDAWVFRDELQMWADKGYDYVGAPWIPTEYYWKRTWGMLVQNIRKLFPVNVYRIPHCLKYFAVGNGGFSLRKISTMRQITVDDREIIDKCRYFEDWYISLVASRTHKLKIPDYHEALKFSFEQSLSHCYSLNHKELPFGCHYWSRPKNYERFWHRFIS